MLETDNVESAPTTRHALDLSCLKVKRMRQKGIERLGSDPVAERYERTKS